MILEHLTAVRELRGEFGVSWRVQRGVGVDEYFDMVAFCDSKDAVWHILGLLIVLEYYFFDFQ